MRSVRYLPLAVLLVACQNEGSLVLGDPAIDLEVLTPEYGAFLDDAPATVTGTVQPAWVPLTIEDEPVEVAEDGSFTAEVPVDHDYRIVDVEAAYGEAYERVRVPVFRGNDPADTWPGGVTMRLTPSGLERMGVGLGAMIDELGWEQMILDQLPSFSMGSWLSLTPVDVVHDPTVVELLPATGGVDTAVSFRQVDILMDLTVTLPDQAPFTLPVTVGYDEIALGALAVPAVDAEGYVSLTLTEADLVFGEPDVTVASLDGWLLELLMQGVGFVVEPLGEILLDTVLDEYGYLELGGPYAFETDLMGTSVEARLSDLFGDLGGVGAGLGLGLDEPAVVGPLPIPTPTPEASEVHASLGLHEGLMQRALLGTGLLDMLTQSIELPGTFGQVIGRTIEDLPGGSQAPEGDGWCMALQPNDARVVRLKDDLAPWTVLYLPDVEVDIGVMSGGSCESWLVTSLAFEVGIDVRAGTVLKMDVEIPEGAVVSYGADRDLWTEDAIVDEMADFTEGSLGLLGAQFEIDLADFLGGMAGGTGDPILDAMGDLEPRILASRPLYDLDGVQPEGLYAIDLSLWSDPAP